MIEPPHNPGTDLTNSMDQAGISFTISALSPFASSPSGNILLPPCMPGNFECFAMHPTCVPNPVLQNVAWAWR